MADPDLDWFFDEEPAAPAKGPMRGPGGEVITVAPQETSRLAGEALKGRVTALEQQAREQYRQAGAQGLTVRELMARLGWDHNRASARLHSLERKGWVIDKGERRVTDGASTARVLVYVDNPVPAPPRPKGKPHKLGPLGPLDHQILNYLDLGPATDDEISVATGIKLNTVTAQRPRLVTRGLVKQTEERRLTRKKSLAIVWRIATREEVQAFQSDTDPLV
jgi:DNA-binding MarR family transcriptional regulator